MVSQSFTAAVESGAGVVGILLLLGWLGLIALAILQGQPQLGAVLFGLTLTVAIVAYINER